MFKGARSVINVQEVRTIRRNGGTYEFGRDHEPEFISSTGVRYPALTTFWARVFNGREWTTLHHIITEGK